MKRVLSVILCEILVFCLVGCSVEKNNFEIGGVSNIEVVEEDITLSIKEGTLSNSGATLILKNNSDVDISYGTPYELEIKKDDKWHKINVELYFTMPAFELNPGEGKEIELSWENSYGKLAKGEYRIIKGYSKNIEETEYKELYVSAEFIIE